MRELAGGNCKPSTPSTQGTSILLIAGGKSGNDMFYDEQLPVATSLCDGTARTETGGPVERVGVTVSASLPATSSRSTAGARTRL